MEQVESHCRHLNALARKRLLTVPGVRLVGTVNAEEDHTGPISFTVANMLSHMVARALSDAWGICVRSGYHCAQPLHEHLRTPPSLRVSFGWPGKLGEPGVAGVLITSLFRTGPRAGSSTRSP